MDGVISAEEIFYYTEPRCIEQQPTIYDGYPGELPLITYNQIQDNRREKEGHYDNINSPMINKYSMVYVENSNVCGYITDQSTNDPIENAYVRLGWRDDSGNQYLNSTYTDLSGYYSINVPAGELYFNIFADYYFYNHTDWISIGDNVTLWLNFSLIPYPPENSVICGFITDGSTGEPIVDAEVDLRWNVGQYRYDNDTRSDAYGYYSINIAAGDVRIYAYADRYFSEHTDWFNIGDDEIFWLNISLESLPPENSVVCGYVTDESTGDAIEDAYVELVWIYNDENKYWNNTETDHDGFFSFNVASGKMELRLFQHGYFEVKEYYYILDEEILWVNISPCPLPAENSIICGYILDNETFEPLSDSFFHVDWFDGKGHYKWSGTHTNRYGFFEMNVACGEMYFWIYCEGYNPVRTYRTDVSENETYWFNISLKKDPIRVDIIKPLNAIYIGNHRILPSSIGVVFGRIDIEAYVHDYWYQPAEIFKMEFYVDGVLRETVSSEPFIWTWDDQSFGGHTVKVVAYDADGKYAGFDETTVWKFL
jgi:5-hydroxyisourate hydrolase-like protein (transthyretin family)